MKNNTVKANHKLDYEMGSPELKQIHTDRLCFTHGSHVLRFMVRLQHFLKSGIGGDFSEIMNGIFFFLGEKLMKERIGSNALDTLQRLGKDNFFIKTVTPY